MERLFFALVLLALFTPISRAQQDPEDPGLQDSIIIDIAPTDSGNIFFHVSIYAITDDSVMFYNMPLRWSSIGGPVIPDTAFSYFPPLISWDDCFDTVLTIEGYIRQFGYADLGGENNPPLNTDGHRQLILGFPLNLNEPHMPNTVVLDSTWDSRNGSLVFGLSDGVSEITPGFRRGYWQFNSIEDENSINPKSFSLSQNYPNPFNSSTIIEFELDKAGYTALDVYDLLGRRVRTLVSREMDIGWYSVIWDGHDSKGLDAASGIYYYCLKGPGMSLVNKMTLLR